MVTFSKYIVSFKEVLDIYKEREIPLYNVENALIKRIFDILFSLTFLITIFPIVYVVLAIAIKLNSPGSVFFRQERTGKGGNFFRCYKFRSMYINSEMKQACINDSRLTSIGRFIRRTNLDELPQFINILKGEMSVVGPRPHPIWLDNKYSPLINEYMRRNSIKPGLTGLAQINGFRGETKSIEDMENRIKKDILYIDNWTFGLDIHIILKTILNMLHGEKNAY